MEYKAQVSHSGCDEYTIDYICQVCDEYIGKLNTIIDPKNPIFLDDCGVEDALEACWCGVCSLYGI